MEIIIIEERMLNYSSKSRPIIAALQKAPSTKENSGCVTPEPKRVAFQPARLQIPPKNAYTGPTYEAALTPKTARTTYNNSNALNGSFSRSPMLTPDKLRAKKDQSFVQREGEEARTELRAIENERSRKATKTVAFQMECGDAEERLRQTVSSASCWLRNNMPPKPIKSQADFDPDRRRKIDSAYLPATQPPKEEAIPTPLQFPPRSHARTRTACEEGVATPVKQQKSQATTPRISQEKLTRSVNLKLNPMSRTDPQGCFTRTAEKRLSSTPHTRGLSLSDFSLGACKGEGRFGRVFPAVHRRTGFLVAIKQVKKEAVRLMLEQFVQQLKISLFLSHGNVVRFYGFFSDAAHFYILMEYMEEGSLYGLLRGQRRLPEREAAEKMGEVCAAVGYLHALDVLHRDIKPENIVLSHGVCKLCDFGWAAYSRGRRTTYCGTLDYVSPEIIEGEAYDQQVDIWAVGVLAFELLTGRAPFYHISRQETMNSILKCDFGFPEDMSQHARGFISKALQRTPGQRVTIEQLLKDPFLEAARTID